MKTILTALLVAISIQCQAEASASVQVVKVIVNEKGFVPSTINVVPDRPVILKVTRKLEQTCSKIIQIPSLHVKKPLPLNKEVILNLGPLKSSEIKFGCGMDMMEGGVIVVRPR